MKLKQQRKRALPAVLALAGLSITSYGLAQQTVPRGPGIETTASHCRIGPFEQANKAGPYNELCEIMTDSEKCLALLKTHFKYDGGTQPASLPYDKARLMYCLATLSDDLGLEFEAGE